MVFKISKCLLSTVCRKNNPIFQIPRIFHEKLYYGLAGSSKNFSTCKSENQAVVLKEIKKLQIESKPIPKYDDDQVLLQMEVVGICGSDVHFYLHGKLGPFLLKAPMIIGHEASGTVLECGKNVKHLKPGDQVALEPQKSCKRCDFCKSGRYNLCPDIMFCATPPHDGNLSTYFVNDADFCYKLPSNMDLEHGALMEPLSVGVHACKRVGITAGDAALVFGAGPIGLVTAMSARGFGAIDIVIVDINDFKLSIAKKLGFKNLINNTGMSDECLVKNIYEKLGKRPDCSFEGTGAAQPQRVCLKATKNGGKVVYIGNGTDLDPLPIMESITREVACIGSFRYCNDYPTAINLVSSGKVDPKPIITHHFPFKDSVKAFEMAAASKEPFVKILIHANPNWKPSGDKCK